MIVLRKRILVIDDEVCFTNALKRVLEGSQKYRVRVESEVMQGIIAAWEFMPDLIMLGPVMSKMWGAEIAERIKCAELLKDVPII